jgi:hypothetical protein
MMRSKEVVKGDRKRDRELEEGLKLVLTSIGKQKRQDIRSDRNGGGTGKIEKE